MAGLACAPRKAQACLSPEAALGLDASRPGPGLLNSRRPSVSRSARAAAPLAEARMNDCLSAIATSVLNGALIKIELTQDCAIGCLNNGGNLI
jgi:hypothetical protein